MAIEYVNRRGVKYYLLQGTTKTGKPKFFASKKPEGVVAAKMPEGFEFHEHPERGLVSVRKIRPSSITAEEKAFLEERIRTLAGINNFRVDIQKDSLVIYTSSTNPEEILPFYRKVFGINPFREKAALEIIGNSANFSPTLCFTLQDEKERLFSVERWCYRGGMEGWHYLKKARPLERQAKDFLPDLRGESFFDLI